eukprot:152287_1
MSTCYKQSIEEFTQRQLLIINKRISAINNTITKKSCVVWNQHLGHNTAPSSIKFNFQSLSKDQYLTESAKYKTVQRKLPNSEWWGSNICAKQNALAQRVLSNILDEIIIKANYIGQHTSDGLQTEFTNYCTFELLETAITAVFHRERSGTSEVFIRTAFQHSRGRLRKKLKSYFTAEELEPYDRQKNLMKKKDFWCTLIKQKKQKLFTKYAKKKTMILLNGFVR